MGKKIAVMMVAEVISFLGIICSIGMLIANALKFVEGDLSTWIMFLVANMIMFLFILLTSKKGNNENKDDYNKK